MTPTISVTGLSRRYRGHTALDNVSLAIEPDTVTGLLGRNGAGKTTLLRILTGLEFPTAGEIKVFGAAPAENDAVLRRIVFVREEQAYPDFRVGHAIRVASWFYPNWSAELAEQLLADFELPLGRRIRRLVNVARYHLVDRITYVALPWGILAFSFVINLAIAAMAPQPPDGMYTGGLVTIYVFLLICGVLSMTRELPFGLMLGVSRRGYYLGTALLVLALGVVYGLALTVLQALERASGGWGFSLHYFRVPWIMDGPWYQTWVTSFVLLLLFFGYGMWYGLVYRRWSVVGLVTFVIAQMLVALAVVAVVTLTHHWTAFGHFFTTMQVPALTGVLAALTIALGLGGFSTIRRATI